MRRFLVVLPRLCRCLRLALLVGLAGCVTPPLTGQAWVRVESENFVLYSQISEQETLELAKKLETFREVTRRFTNAGPGAFEPTIPTLTYVFDSAQEYEKFAPFASSTGFIAPLQRANYIALNGRSSALAATRVIYHEFVHQLLRNSGKAGYPHWFDEGLAEYLGASVIDDENIVLAAVPEDRLAMVREFQLLPLERLLKARDTSAWSAEEKAMFYAQSWALVHYLNLGGKSGMVERKEQLDAYLELLNEGLGVEAAFAQAFGATFEEVGKELGLYVGRDTFMQIRKPRSAFPPAKVVSVRVATPAEVALQLGQLALATGNDEAARSLFDASLALEPRSPRALAGLALAVWKQGGGTAVEIRLMLERAAALGPQDALNHLDLAEYLLAQAEAGAERPGYPQLLVDARSALVRALELEPEMPEAYALAAKLYTLPGQDWRKGLVLIEQAHALLPSDASIAISLADFYVVGGEHDRAERLLDAAAQWADEAGGAKARAIQRVRGRLAEARAASAARR
jgi:tetratricopeptide (TPR) repeat protein